MAQIGAFGGPQVVLPFLGAALALVVAVVLWLRNVPNYRKIRAATRHRAARLPEEILASYHANYLQTFMRALNAATIPEKGNALEFYREPTLLWNDVWFAAAFGTFLVLGNIAIARFVPLSPYGDYLAYFCAAMGAAYAVFDILEDRALAQIFAHGPGVNGWQAARASLWTTAKFATLYLAFPAAIGLIVKLGHDHAYDVFFGTLKMLPLVVLLAACVWTPLARVLWACRISVISALAGYFLFLFVIQAQDLFADTTFGRWPLILYWAGVFAAVAFIWALPVHYAARAAVQGDEAAPYLRAGAPEGLVRWTPRVLGMIPVVAVLLGIFGAAVETRYASKLDPGLQRQYVLLAMGGWVTLGFIYVMMVERRRLVVHFLEGPRSRPSTFVVWFCAAATTVVFLFLVSAPVSATNYVARAALTPFLLGSGVLLFGWLSRLSDRLGKPIVGILVALVVWLTALNAHFNDVRLLPIATKDDLPRQMSLPFAVKEWRAANHCPVSDSATDGASLKTCPPALIVAADGGASRAAYFAATVLGEILGRLSKPDTEHPDRTKCVDASNPARCVFAMSGVSGGSLGLAAAKAALLDAGQGPPCEGGGEWKDCLQRLVSGDYLSPGFVGLAFRDQFAPPFWPFTDPGWWGDRADLLEKSWERHYRSQVSTAKDSKDRASDGKPAGLGRPFAKPRADGRWTPLLLLNGTSVQTGRRIIASELEPIWMKEPDETPQALHRWAYDLFDILGASCGGDKDEAPNNCASIAGANGGASANVRLSTAALLSARFPIISPAGTIHMGGKRNSSGDNPHGDEIVDGGYFENSGLTTALDVAAGLKTLGLTPVVLSISNDPTADTQAAQRGAIAVDCKTARPADPSSLHLEVRAAATNSIWMRAVNVLYAPFAALFHTRDGHAEEAGGVLTQRLQEWDVPDSVAGNPCDPGASARYATFFPIRVYAEGSDFAMPDISMSWWLSPVVRKALNRQLEHPQNRMQMKLLLSRMGREGCPDCDGTVQK